MDNNFIERKKKVDNLLLKNEISITLQLLKPFNSKEMLNSLDLTDDFIFHNFEDIDGDINYFLNRNIDYNKDVEKIFVILEKVAYIDVFMIKTVDMIKALCKKINEDLKHLNPKNVELNN